MADEQTKPVPAPAGPSGGNVDAQNPWPGLASYTEETRAYFHGRDEDAAELSRRVQRKLLTVLFGQSGHGKTSLLRAGLVPRLRPEGFCPVYVRLDYDPQSPPPSEQIKREVFRATRAAGTWTQSGSAVEGESLWEFLHHRDDVLRDAKGRVLTPILIFDQFEEIFTLAQTDEAGRKRAQAFLADLADLVENRPPVGLEARIDRDEVDAAKFDFARADYRILIALREDYLAHLEGLKATMPSVTQNRVRLARFTGPQAFAAVRSTAPTLVNEDVAVQIVRFVAGGTDLAQAEVEPSLLSLVCRELNNTRIARGQAAITADLLAGSRETILQEFYERALADEPAGVRRFIEDELLTESGYRESVAEERVRKAFTAAGAAPDALAQLVARRLLRVEERLDVRRVELTHDVLCGVVAVSRGVRHEREARDATERQLAEQKAKEAATRRSLVRARAIAAVCAVLMVVAAGSAVFGWMNLRRARVAERQADQTRRLAEQARSEAEKLVGFLLEDFYNELEPTGRLEIVEKLARQAVGYYDDLPAELRTPATQKYRAMAETRLGSALFQHGSGHESEVYLERARKTFAGMREKGDTSEDVLVGEALSIMGGVAPGLGLAARAVELQQSADRLKPLVMSPHGSYRAKRVYGDMLNYLSHTKAPEAAIATCEEARAVLATIGGADASDLEAAAAYADVGDSEARHASVLGRYDDAERLEIEVKEIAVKVLAKQPGNMHAMQDLWYSPDVLAAVALRRHRHEQALALAREAEQAAESYVRFNPGDTLGWQFLAGTRTSIGDIQLDLGKLTEAADAYRSAGAVIRDTRNTTGISGTVFLALTSLAILDADMGRSDAAKEDLAAVRKTLDQFQQQIQSTTSSREVSACSLASLELRLAWLAGERDLQKRASALLERADNIKQDGGRVFRDDVLRHILQNQAEVSLASGQFKQAEQAAVRGPELLNSSDPSFNAAGYRASFAVLAAQARAGQGRLDEARTMLAPALAHYAAEQERGANQYKFRLDYARARFVQALCEPPDNAAARSADLDAATALIAGMPGEAGTLRDVQFLAGWIKDARSAAK